MDEAELLFTGILNCDRQGLYSNRKAVLRKAQGRIIGQALRRRMKGEPLQYILAKTEFMGLEFKVNKDVFIPRPETEILVETAIEIVRKFVSSQVRKLRILDLGTGSGCIAVSLAKMLPDLEVTAADVSPCALQTARENARLHNVTINFIQSNLFGACELHATSYDLIICNPPYVPAAEINNLQPEISYEPRLALDGGSDGLDFYRRIIGAAGDYLEKDGILIMEMGLNQYSRIKEIFRDSGKFDIIEAVKDYNGIERIVVAQYILSAKG